MAQLIKYSNGLRLIVESIPHVRSVAAGIMVGTGSAMENEHNNGISHYIEHVLFKGTDKLTAFDIANSFERRGAVVNAFTSKEMTCFYFKSIDNDVENCFETLSDLILHSVFDKKELDSERKVVLEEINMEDDSPEDICFDLLAKALYGTQPIGMSVLGKRENVARFDKSEIEEYMERRYRADSIVVVFAGNILPEQADSIVRKYLLPELGNKKSESAQTFSHYEPSAQSFIKDFKQANLMIGYPSMPYNDPLCATQSLLNMILGGCMGSRLFQDIREKKGLAYSVYSSPSRYNNCGSFNIALNINGKNTAMVLGSVFEELENVKTSGITPAELDMAKAQIKATLIFGQEAPQSLMISFGKAMLAADELFDMDAKIREIDNVTAEDVNALAKSLFAATPAIAYVGSECGVDFNKYIRR